MYSYVTIECTNKIITVHDHMTHVVKIDIITRHEEKGNLHFILKIIFHCIFIEKNMHFLKTYTVNYESIAYCLTKFCRNIYF